jgi:hypothetical protein
LTRNGVRRRIAVTGNDGGLMASIRKVGNAGKVGSAGKVGKAGKVDWYYTRKG